MNPETRAPIRFRKLGWLLMAIGLLLSTLFWAVLLPLVKRQDPSLEPRLSLEAFWEEKQQALNLGLITDLDAWFMGLFGDKAWTEKTVQWVIEVKTPLLVHDTSLANSLPFLTNHQFPRNTDAAVVWAKWWKEHHSQSQEQWIQEGFRQHGFEIALPPSEKDWPKLLSLLGAASGPIEFPFLTVEELYPEYLRYNAYRWLRDSGFDPMRYLTDHTDQSMQGDESGGVIEYQQAAGGLELLISPMPGRMAFTNQEWYGGKSLNGGLHLQALLHPGSQVGVNLGFAALFFVGLCLARRRRTVTLPRSSVTLQQETK